VSGRLSSMAVEVALSRVVVVLLPLSSVVSS
jgi:hypothetical protein